jgi:hypothetical protein
MKSYCHRELLVCLQIIMVFCPFWCLVCHGAQGGFDASSGEEVSRQVPDAAPGRAGSLVAFSAPAGQGAAMPGQAPYAPAAPQRAVGVPASNPSGGLPPLPKALPYSRSDSKKPPQGPEMPVARQGTPPRVQVPVIPDTDGSILANVPQTTTQSPWRGDPSQTRPAGQGRGGHSIGEFILDSFASAQPEKMPEDKPEQKSAPDPAGHSFIEQVAGIGKAIRNVVTGK